MLTIPMGSEKIINLLGIDPGSTNVGIAVMTVDIDTLQILSTVAWSINGAKLCNKESWIEEIYSNRVVRIAAIEEALLQIFNYYNPTIFICELPFINSKFPLSGVVLTEVLSAIRSAVMRYDIWKSLTMVPPSSVKNSVFAKGNADKHQMKEAVMGLPDINYSGNIPLVLLDEHAIDAIAVTYSKYREIKNTYI